MIELSVANLYGGGVVERIHEELNRAIQNIVDPNTPATTCAATSVRNCHRGATSFRGWPMPVWYPKTSVLSMRPFPLDFSHLPCFRLCTGFRTRAIGGNATRQ